jgi:hypothetical protein
MRRRKGSIIVLFVVVRLMRVSLRVLMVCVGSAGMTRWLRKAKACLEMLCEMVEEEFYEFMRCGRKITREEFETYDGMCEECYLIEIDELDYEDEDY